MVTPKEINHYFYVGFHPVPDEAVIADRMTRYHDTLASQGPEGRQALGRGVEAGRHRARTSRRKTADYSGLSDAELVAKLDEFTDQMTLPVVDPRPHQLRPPVQQRVLRHVRRGDAARRSRPRRTRPSRASTPARSTPAAACGSSAGSSRTARRCRSCSHESRSDRDRWPSSTRPRRAARSASSSTRSCTSSAGAATPSTTSPTCRGGRTRRSRCRASPASSTSTTARIPRSCTGRRSASARSCSPRPRRSWPTIPTRWPSSTSSTRRPSYSFPLTEDHAFYIDQLGVGVFRRFVLAVGDRARAEGRDRQAPTTSSSSTATRCVDALTNGGDDAPTWSPSAGRAFERGGAGRRRPGASARRPPIPPDDAVDPFMDAIVVPPARAWCRPRTNPDPNDHQGRGRLARRLHRRPPGSCGRSPRRSDLEDGEVMVCEMTLPPWVPLFSIAGAVVSDVGGVLSPLRDRRPRVRHPRRRRRGQPARRRSRPARPSPSTAPRASSTSTAAPSPDPARPAGRVLPQLAQFPPSGAASVQVVGRPSQLAPRPPSEGVARASRRWE